MYIVCNLYLLVFLLLLLSFSEHDLRLDLSSFKLTSTAEYPMFQEFLSSVAKTSPNTISLVPVGPDSEWAVTILRQRTRKAYHLRESVGRKYLVTISAVREYRMKERDLKPSDTLEVNLDKIPEETEIEVRYVTAKIIAVHYIISSLRGLA